MGHRRHGDGGALRVVVGGVKGQAAGLDAAGVGQDAIEGARRVRGRMREHVRPLGAKKADKNRSVSPAKVEKLRERRHDGPFGDVQRLGEEAAVEGQVGEARRYVELEKVDAVAEEFRLRPAGCDAVGDRVGLGRVELDDFEGADVGGVRLLA